MQSALIRFTKTYLIDKNCKNEPLIQFHTDVHQFILSYMDGIGGRNMKLLENSPSLYKDLLEKLNRIGKATVENLNRQFPGSENDEAERLFQIADSSITLIEVDKNNKDKLAFRFHLTTEPITLIDSIGCNHLLISLEDKSNDLNEGKNEIKTLLYPINNDLKISHYKRIKYTN